MDKDLNESAELVEVIGLADVPARAKPKAKPDFLPTQEQREAVRCAAAVRTPEKVIAGMILDFEGKPLSVAKLREHFAAELDDAADSAHARVANTVYQAALDGDVKAAKYWLSTQAGWIEARRVEHTGAGGDPIAVEHQVKAAVGEVRGILDALSGAKRNSGKGDGGDGAA